MASRRGLYACYASFLKMIYFLSFHSHLLYKRLLKNIYLSRLCNLLLNYVYLFFTKRMIACVGVYKVYAVTCSVHSLPILTQKILAWGVFLILSWKNQCTSFSPSTWLNAQLTFSQCLTTFLAVV
jgi:hypothetical protein